jgi:hypothetical protein
MSDNSVFEFGFDEGTVIKAQGIDRFKQTRPGQKDRLSIVSFKRVHDGVLLQKTREKGSPLTDAEKTDLMAKIDKKIAEQLGKPVEQLTEVDRLDIKSPKFAFAWTHYRDGLGSIRCLSQYEGKTVTKPELCCNKMGDADQTVGMIVMTYPVKDGVQVDEELLNAKKYVNFSVWRMTAKKFRQIEDAYKEARGEDKFTIDLIVTLDGDPKYQKQVITPGSASVWAKGKMDSEVRNWVLDQGLRNWKHVSSNLGFDMKIDKLREKLMGGSPAQTGGSEASDAPRLVGSYDDFLAS